MKMKTVPRCESFLTFYLLYCKGVTRSATHFGNSAPVERRVVRNWSRYLQGTSCIRTFLLWSYQQDLVSRWWLQWSTPMVLPFRRLDVRMLYTGRKRARTTHIVHGLRTSLLLSPRAPVVHDNARGGCLPLTTPQHESNMKEGGKDSGWEGFDSGRLIFSPLLRYGRRL